MEKKWIMTKANISEPDKSIKSRQTMLTLPTFRLNNMKLPRVYLIFTKKTIIVRWEISTYKKDDVLRFEEYAIAKDTAWR
ncbi:hypothetical protein [Alkalibacterium sp.]|uniref:hypothetical protein n=1 Tax=Alkalibacterium sp. TaxID=1872447 RepID=UPI0039708902